MCDDFGCMDGLTDIEKFATAYGQCMFGYLYFCVFISYTVGFGLKIIILFLNNFLSNYIYIIPTLINNFFSSGILQKRLYSLQIIYV